MNDKTGKTFRIAAIVMMGLTAAMNILGGIGTTCAAFGLTKGYRMAFAALLKDHQWLYQTFVFVTTIIGLFGVWAVLRLLKGKSNAYRDTLIILVVGTMVNGYHYYMSQTLRGKAAPANVVFYFNAFTLLIFLLIKLPGLRERVSFDEPGGEEDVAGGLTAFIAGMLTLTTALWIGPSHMPEGVNWTLALEVPLTLVGGALALGGLGKLVAVGLKLMAPEKTSAEPEQLG